MGLRCLIGHEYGDPQTSRDRRQQGSEVVVTVQEYRECARCGHRRVISENTEVKVEPPAEPEPIPAPSVDASWSPPEPMEGDGSASAPGPADDTDEPLTAEEDDGIILEDEPDGPHRAHGQWPETDLGDEAAGIPDDHDPWPNEQVNPEPSTRRSDQPEPDHGGAEPADDPSASAAVADPSAAGGDPVGQAAPTRSTSAPTPSPDPRDIELVCPDCGDTWPSMNASLRPGDICPECHNGYLDEQVIQ